MTWRDSRIPVEVIQDNNYLRLIEEALPASQQITDFAKSAVQTLSEQLRMDEIKLYLRSASYHHGMSADVKKNLEALHYMVFPIIPPQSSGEIAELEEARAIRLRLYSEIDGFLLLRAGENVWTDLEILGFIRDRADLWQKYNKELPAAVLDTIGDAPQLPQHYRIDVLSWTNDSGASEVQNWIEHRGAARPRLPEARQ